MEPGKKKKINGIVKISFIVLLAVIIFLVVFTSKMSKKKGITDGKDNAVSVVEDNNEIITARKTVTTKSGMVYIVDEEKISASNSNITVSGEKFPENNEPVVISDIYPLEKVILADLDNDGYQEIYLICRSVGSGRYAKITGITSYRDKSFGLIYTLPDNSYENDLFKGYMGHDKIYLINGLLIREFSVYNEGDSNYAPAGGKRKLKYTLKSGEESYILEAALSS